MQEVTIEELRQLASACRDEVWRVAESVGREPKIYLHWSAGHYEQLFSDYHINIDWDGRIYLSTPDLADVLEHTWHRNTGSIGVCLCCAFGADTNDLGDEPPTSAQIDVCAQVIAVLCDALWLTIDKLYVMTHGEAADNEDGSDADEPYGPRNGCERWDLEYLGTDESPTFNPYATDGSRGGDVLRGKAIWYRQHFRAEAVGGLSS